MLPKYTIITKARVYESEPEEIAKEIEEKMAILHLNNNEDYLCHFFDSDFHYEVDEYLPINEAIQGLAIKDGYNIVIFEGYGFGFVAYYNGEENGFAILDAQKGSDTMKVYLVMKVFDNCEDYEDYYTYNDVEEIFSTKEKAVEYINDAINGIVHSYDDTAPDEVEGVIFTTDTSSMEPDDAIKARNALRMHRYDHYIFEYDKDSRYENVCFYGYYVDEREVD